MLERLFARPAPVPVPSGARDRRISDVEHVNMAADAEFADVDALAAAMGIEVQLHPYRPEIVGTLQRFGDQWIIGVNRANPLTRRRFTVAHEIGHYVWHRDLVAMRRPLGGIADGPTYRQPDVDPQRNEHVTAEHETQANRCAIAILMGTDKMRRLMDEGLSAEQIAPIIGCSVETTRIRIGTLTKQPTGR